MITIQELLYNRGLQRDKAIKLVRHKSRGMDLYDTYRKDKATFFAYQNKQGKEVFKGVDYIVSFIGEEGVRARFVGVFKILGRDYECREKDEREHFYYKMEEIRDYEDLKERVVIRWDNPISWHQWIKNKMEVLEISPGLLYKRFTDYAELLLSFDELQEIIENEYPDWHSVLSSVKGIYLITDMHTGKLYVGSAYGENGFWGRWSEYVNTNGTGGNKELIKLIEKDNKYAHKYFQFSILMLLPKTVTAEIAISAEQLFKRKLGTNAFGLNKN